MKSYLEIVKFAVNDVVTASSTSTNDGPPVLCEDCEF